MLSSPGIAAPAVSIVLSADELAIHRQQIAGVEGTYRCWLVSNGVNSVLCGLLTEVSASAGAGPRVVAWREVEIRELLVFITGVPEIVFDRRFSHAHGRFVYDLLKAELQQEQFATGRRGRFVPRA